MEYDSNKVISILKKNSELPPEESTTTRSVYYYWKNYSFRYSDHKTTSNRTCQFNIVFWYRPLGFLIKEPGKDTYNWHSEAQTYTFLRRLEKRERKAERKRKDSQKRKMTIINQIIMRTRKEKKRLKRLLFGGEND